MISWRKSGAGRNSCRNEAKTKCRSAASIAPVGWQEEAATVMADVNNFWVQVFFPSNSDSLIPEIWRKTGCNRRPPWPVIKNREGDGTAGTVRGASLPSHFYA